MVQRVAVYIDGFNLYYGLRSKRWRRYYWLDIRALSVKLLRPGQRLMRVKYFTAPVLSRPDDPGQQDRQRRYLGALATLRDVQILYGYFLSKMSICPACGANRETFEEKMTDVNIAVELLGDACDDAFDTAIIISGDSDLSGPISAVRLRHPDKSVIVAFPPNRTSFRMRQSASASFTIGRRMFSGSLLPERVHTAAGYDIEKPPEWA